MKKTIFLLCIIGLIAITCTPRTEKCAITIDVPFVSIDIPDSIENDRYYTIDAEILDYGCFEECNLVIKKVNYDTLVILATALRDECDCPIKSVTTTKRRMALDTTYCSKNVYIGHLQVNAAKDSMRWEFKNVKIY